MNIKEFFKEYNIDNIIDITKLAGGLVNNNYKVICDNNTYVINY